jgi:hypothetical protein
LDNSDSDTLKGSFSADPGSSPWLVVDPTSRSGSLPGITAATIPASLTAIAQLFVGMAHISADATAGGESDFGTNCYYASGWKYRYTDTASRVRLNGNVIEFYNAASGTAGNAITWILAATIDASGNFKLAVAGGGIYIKEGTNACMGIATLVAGVVVVSTTKVTANSRIFLTRQTVGGTVGTSVDVTARTAGTSFTITAAGSILDTSTVAWEIKEPA